MKMSKHFAGLKEKHSMFPYHTDVTEVPAVENELGKWLTASPLEWTWQMDRNWLDTWPIDEGRVGMVMFKTRKDQLVFELACSEYVVQQETEE